MRRRPPHILVTTPESLYVLLGSQSGRAMLANARSVIVDEIHAVAPNKRGAHLALSLERLAALCGDRLQRIGLSATQNPIEAVAHFLAGAAADGKPAAEVAIIDAGHQRQARFEPGGSRIAARGGDVERSVDGSLRTPDRADRGAPHDAGVRQHPAHGRTHRARAHRSSRQRRRHRASRQHGEGAQARRRTAAEARRTESPGGDRLARARDRYRRRQSRLSDRFAALDRDLLAARRPFRSRDRRHAQGAPVSALARRSGRVCSASRQRPSRRA